MIVERFRYLAAALATVCSLLVFTPALAEAPIAIWVDGKPIAMDVAPVIINGRTMVPARFVAEALGAGVEWDQENQRVVITSKEAKAAAEIAAAEADTVYIRDLVELYGADHTTDEAGNLRVTKNGVTVVISVSGLQRTGDIMAPVIGHPSITEVRVFTVGSRTVMTKVDAATLGLLP